MKRKLQVFFENIVAVIGSIALLGVFVGACRWFVEFVCYSWNISGDFLYNLGYMIFGG